MSDSPPDRPGGILSRGLSGPGALVLVALISLTAAPEVLAARPTREFYQRLLFATRSYASDPGAAPRGFSEGAPTPEAGPVSGEELARAMATIVRAGFVPRILEAWEETKADEERAGETRPPPVSSELMPRIRAAALAYGQREFPGLPFEVERVGQVPGGPAHLWHAACTNPQGPRKHLLLQVDTRTWEVHTARRKSSKKSGSVD